MSIQVWVSPPGHGSKTLVAITSDSFICAKDLTEDACDRLRSELKEHIEGSELSKVGASISGDVVVVSLRDVIALRKRHGVYATQGLEVEFTRGDGVTTTLSIAIESGAIAHQVLNAMATRLGPSHDHHASKKYKLSSANLILFLPSGAFVTLLAAGLTFLGYGYMEKFVNLPWPLRAVGLAVLPMAAVWLQRNEIYRMSGLCWIGFACLVATFVGKVGIVLIGAIVTIGLWLWLGSVFLLEAEDIDELMPKAK